MDIQLQLPPKSLTKPAKDTSLQVHFLPCAIDFEGPAKVSTYFMPEQIDTSEGKDNADTDSPLLEAGFRGRQLKGREIRLPDGYSGYCFTETSAASAGVKRTDTITDDMQEHDESRYWKTSGRFESMTVWEHDFEPTRKDNVLLRIGDWVQLSQALHGDD